MRRLAVPVLVALGAATVSVLAGAAPDEPSTPPLEAPDGGAPPAAPAPPPEPSPPPAATTDAGPPPPGDVGFSLGLRAGYSVPFGRAKDGAFSDVLSGVIPIGIDVGYFVTRHLYVGGYFVYGFASASDTSDTCSAPDTTCSATQFRFGAAAHWHFLPELALDPWVGLALGYDVVNLSATSQATSELLETASDHGFEATLQAGADYKPLKYFGAGPFAEVTLGHFAETSSATRVFGLASIGVRFRTGL